MEWVFGIVIIYILSYTGYKAYWGYQMKSAIDQSQKSEKINKGKLG